MSPTQSIPRIATVDLAIIGGSSHAVAAALAAHAAGKSVYLVAPRPYLGEDICARFAFWEPVASDSELAARLFPTDTPPTPMHIKHSLEQALVAAGIPFLLNSHPAGVLRQADAVAGVVIANRRGHQAISAGAVLDASREGLLCRQAGLPFTATASGVTEARLVTLNGPAHEATDAKARDLPSFTAQGKKESLSITAREYRLDLDFGDGSWTAIAKAQAEAVERCWATGVWQQSETLDYLPASHIDQALIEEPTATSLEVASGLWCLGPAAPINRQLAADWDRPLALLDLAEELGAQIGATAPNATPTASCAAAEPVATGIVRSYDNGLRPHDDCQDLVPGPTGVPRLGRFDVVVIGGGTGGAPAAISAGRAGASTLVCEHMPALGGVGTLGQISNYYFGNRVGFTAEIDRGVREIEPTELKEGWWTPSAKAAWFHHEAHEAGVTMAFGVTCCGVWLVDDRIRGVVVAGPMGYGLIEAGAVVDSTGCADVVGAAGAPVTGIGHEHVAVQGTGLAGVSPDKRYNNSDHSFSDDTDMVDATQFLVSAKEKFKDHFDAGQLVDSRERQQIIGEMTLDPADFLCERTFPDSICLSSSNFDTHGYTIHPAFMVKPPDKTRMWVYVPYRCLLPEGLKGILVTGLGLSAHRDALPVVRMQPDVQNQGYAAGLAAAWAATADIDVRDIDLKKLQAHLVEIGNLPENVLTDTDSFPVDDARLQRAVREEWDEYAGIALCFAERERAEPLLERALDEASAPDQRLRYAHILGLFGNPVGNAVLQAELGQREWDDGWNYKGMGQFGKSLSETDSLLIALGTSGDTAAWPTLLSFIGSLAPDCDLSHARAVTVASERLANRYPHPDAGVALTEALRRLAVQDCAQTTQAAVQAALTDEQNENGVRNVALRELHLARGAYRCGNPDGIGEAVLQAYAKDLRGHFARHAQALLQAGVIVAEPEAAVTA